MDFTLNLAPNQQAIHFVDQTMSNYTTLYNIPSKRELCFVVHELVINAIEAMKQANLTNGEEIQLHVTQTEEAVTVTVVDQAEGIPEKDWKKYLKFNFDELHFADRGRGLTFVRNMVDDIWFENVSETKFLVGVLKKLNV